MVLLRKYWKIVLSASLALLLSYAALSSSLGVLRLKKEVSRLESDKMEILDNKEAESKRIIAAYTDTLKLKDALIDSFDLALSKKRARIIKIKSDVQLLKGDSVAIINELNRVFTEQANSSNVQQRD